MAAIIAKPASIWTSQWMSFHRCLSVVADVAVRCLVIVYYPMLVFGMALMLSSIWSS